MSCKRIQVFAILAICALDFNAQIKEDISAFLRENLELKDLEVGASIGSTGIGLDAAATLGNYARVRTGFTYMPRFKITSDFSVDVNGQKIDDDKLRRMKDMMNGFTGTEMRDNIDMIMRPTWGNFKFLVDIMPLRDKRWNFTVGFYAGPSQIANAVNKENGTSTLVAVNTYNTLYNRACMGESMFSYEDNKHEMHYADFPASFAEKIVEMRMMGMPLGRFRADGDRAMMVPDENYQARATMSVNKFRPYLGAGFKTNLSKDGAFRMAIDAGVLFWGGHPSIYVDNVYKTADAYNPDTGVYDMVAWDEETFQRQLEAGEVNIDECWIREQPQRIDLTRDVYNIRGKVGDMVKTTKNLRCYPMLSITFSWRLPKFWQ